MLFVKFFKAISIILSILVVNAQSVTRSPAKCSSYPANATCSSYVNYDVYLPENVTISAIEAQFKSLSELRVLLAKVSPVCFDSIFRYQCERAFPKCETVGSEIEVYSPCKSDCEAVSRDCSVIFQMAGYTALLPDCSNDMGTSGTPPQPDGFCNHIESKVKGTKYESAYFEVDAVPAGFVARDCPAPFLKDPGALYGTNSTIDPDYCRFGCCIPCPAQNYFYKENWAIKGFLSTDIIRFVSSVLSLILVISYLILPDKRRHPSLLILNLSFAIFLISMGVFFSIGNTKGLQCSANKISPAAIGNNNLCAAQGSILIFGSFSTVLWVAALIINLHFHTVWNLNFFSDKYVYLNLICWGIPAAITGIAIGLHAIKFEFANLCLVSMQYIFPLFFYPLAAIVCPSFIIHVATFFYIARVAVREGVAEEMTQSLSRNAMNERNVSISHKHVIVAVKIQWRALLLAVVAIGTVLFYWLFYMTQMNKMTELKDYPELTLNWIECMLTPGNTQNTCTSVTKNHLPPFPLIILAEVLVSSIGIWLFIMFGKRSLWREWNDWIYDLRITLSKGRRSEKAGEQFYTL